MAKCLENIRASLPYYSEGFAIAIQNVDMKLAELHDEEIMLAAEGAKFGTLEDSLAKKMESAEKERIAASNDWNELPFPGDFAEKLKNNLMERIALLLNLANANKMRHQEICQALVNLKSKRSELENSKKKLESDNVYFGEMHERLMKQIEGLRKNPIGEENSAEFGQNQALNSTAHNEVSTPNQDIFKALDVQIVDENTEEEPDTSVVAAAIDLEEAETSLEMSTGFEEASLFNTPRIEGVPITSASNEKDPVPLVTSCETPSTTSYQGRTPATIEAGKYFSSPTPPYSPYCSAYAPAPPKKAQKIWESSLDLTEILKEEISNFYILDPRPSRELLTSFATQKEIDANLLAKWFSHENGDGSASLAESNGDCSLNLNESCAMVLTDSETRPVVFGCPFCPAMRNSKDSQDRLVTIRYLSDDADIDSQEFQSSFMKGLPKFTKLTLHKRPKQMKGKVVHVLFEDYATAQSYKKALEERLKPKKLVLSIQAYSEQMESDKNRNNSDENLEIDEVVGFIRDGDFKMYLSRATKSIPPSEDELGSVIKPKKRGRPSGSASQCKRIKN